MQESKKLLIFLCSGAAKPNTKKLSHRIACQFASLGFANIGGLGDLSQQHSAAPDTQNKMIFINDCRSGCVNLLTQGFNKENYLFFDVSPFLMSDDFNIGHYIHSEMLPRIHDKWSSIQQSPSTSGQPCETSSLFEVETKAGSRSTL
jgi:hypothetical protein